MAEAASPSWAFGIRRRERRTSGRRAWFRRPPVLVLIFIVLACALGPFFLAHGSNEIGAGPAFASPSLRFWFGTDDLGHDMVARILVGGRLTLVVAAGGTLVGTITGTAWGVIAAVRGGWIDEVLMRLADSVMAIPQILFALVFLSAFAPSLLSLSIVIGFLLSPTTARVVRGSMLAELEADYAVAARACGQSRIRLALTEALPNVLPQIAVQTTINAASAIMLEATLSFLGLGTQPPNASWGTLLLQGYGKIYNTIWPLVISSLWIVVTIWALTAASDSFRDGQPRRGADD